jgi:hypothetical protein
MAIVIVQEAMQGAQFGSSPSSWSGILERSVDKCSIVSSVYAIFFLGTSISLVLACLWYTTVADSYYDLI